MIDHMKQSFCDRCGCDMQTAIRRLSRQDLATLMRDGAFCLDRLPTVESVGDIANILDMDLRLSPDWPQKGRPNWCASCLFTMSGLLPSTTVWGKRATNNHVRLPGWAKLTAAQRRMMMAYHRLLYRQQYFPTIRELCEELHFSSTNAAHELVGRCIRLGLLSKNRGARTLSYVLGEAE